EIRLSLNLKQEDFAERLGLSRNMIGMMERGEKPISDSTEAKIQLLLINKDNKVSINESTQPIITKSGMRYTELPDGSYNLEVGLVPFEAHARYVSEDVQEYAEWEKVSFNVDRIGRGKYTGWKVKGN